MATEHTPLPWQVDRENPVIVRDADDTMVADCDVFQYTDDGEVQLEDCPANAAFITRACNSHYQLVEALNEAFDFLGGVDDAAEIRDTILAALKLAGAQP